MDEVDQNQPTSTKKLRMDEAAVRIKRIQRFTRQFSIFLQADDEEITELEKPCDKQDENNDEQVFKYPGNLRGIKRKRNLDKKIMISKRKSENVQEIKNNSDTNKNMRKLKRNKEFNHSQIETNDKTCD